MDIKIFVACHEKCFVPQNPLIFPIQVGCKSNGFHLGGMLHDDEGDNISEKNPMYCELTAQYWAWKNIDADYYGFFHYRRYMNFSETVFPTSRFEDAEFDCLTENTCKLIGLDSEKMSDFISGYDCIATTYTDLKRLNPILKSIRHQYELGEFQRKEDLDTVLEIIKERHPEYYKDAVKYLRSRGGYFCNMFIMKKELFNEYCKWLFDILAEHEKCHDFSDYGNEELRVSGYLSERLFGIWYRHHKRKEFKCTELQRTLFKSTEIVEQPSPWFAEKNISVAFAANDAFAPYLSVTMQSLVENTSLESNYDVFILSQDFSEKNKALYKKLFERKNIHIRFVNPLAYISVDKLFTHGHFTKETYFRLALPEMLKNYDKILYLDADLIIKDDVAKLFGEDIGNNLIAGTLDADTAGLYKGFETDRKEYTDNILKLKKPYEYFQGGVLVFNLEEFRKTFKTSEIMDFANSYDWKLLDQDVLNKLCEGRVFYFDMSWNVMADYNGIRIKHIISRAPKNLYEMYMKARKNPKIIHYAGSQKPWFEPSMDFGMEWWEYARKLPYYETVLQRCIDRNASLKKLSRQLAEDIYHKLFPMGTMRWLITQKIMGRHRETVL